MKPEIGPGDLAGAPLGRASEYPEAYDPDLLYAVPRAPQRAALGLSGALPFTGVDLWTAYELTWLDPRGKPIWWIGPAGDVDDAGPGTDFNAVRRGYVSVTPIHVDLTRFQALEKVSSWVGALNEGVGGKNAEEAA